MDQLIDTLPADTIVPPIDPAETTTPIDPVVETQSLDSFAESFPSNKPTRGETPEQKTERQDRHRAVSQKATPDDVKVIGELTKRISAAEAKAGADITQKPGESNRTFGLRRRAELAERLASGTTATVTTPTTVAASQAVVAPVTAPSIPRGAVLPPVKAAGDDPEPDATKYDDLNKWMRDHGLWAGREAIREAHAEHAKVQTAQTQTAEVTRLRTQWTNAVAAAKTKYPDFEQIAFAPTQIPKGSVPDKWVTEHKLGPELLYHLQKNQVELQQILSQPLIDQIESLTLLTQRLSPRMPAVVTEAAATPVVKPVPRPPTSVRTGPMRTNEDAPPDPASLSLDAFAEAYGGSRKRG